MQQQYDVNLPQQPEQLPLFNFNEIYSILSGNLGLRLTHRLDEIKQGGSGDTMPLSHLAGAKDCIQFVTISSLLLRDAHLEPQVQEEHRQTLKQIFTNYAGENPSLFDCTAPLLMLVYASLLNLNAFTIDPKLLERRLPEKEELYLIDIYQKAGPLLPIFVFDRATPYYGDLPSLRLHLTSDFNQLLIKRLQKNIEFYQSNSMSYLLIQNKYGHFTTGYDWTHYPLGKSGHVTFTPEELLGHITFEQSNDMTHIWDWLKRQCARAPNLQSTETIENRTYPMVAEKPLTYFQQGVKFCQENKTTLATGAVAFGIFATYRFLQYRQATNTDDFNPPQAGM